MNRVPFVGPLDRVLLLRTLPILDGLAPAHLAAIAQHAEERFLSRGTMLPTTSGSGSPLVHFIIEGSVDVRYADGHTRHREAGDSVGFLDVLSGSEAPFEARTAQDTVALELDWEAQLDVCQEHFPVVMRYASFLARRTIEAMSANIQFELDEPESTVVSSRMNLVDRILALHRSRTFSSGSFDALAELAHHVREIKWGRRKRIWQLGDDADNFVLLASGTVRCMTAEGTSFRRHAGATLGLYEAISDSKRWHAAVSESSTIALQVDVEPFMDILEDHFDLARDFLGVLAGNLMVLRRIEDGLETTP